VRAWIESLAVEVGPELFRVVENLVQDADVADFATLPQIAQGAERNPKGGSRIRLAHPDG